ncbi:MAG TPA: CpsB/CapC family capsule biosynthesis tyrosine phosphatase [Solirubrobacteraceae bacterium]|jgi:protein-tyrosine phosphatase
MSAARAELHFHILPGVDDGPRTVEESLELAAMARDDGTTTIVATPHVHSIWLPELAERVDALRGHLAEAGLALELRCGGELAFDDLPELSDASLELIAHGPPGDRWVLLEAPLRHTGARAEDFTAAAGELRSRGFGVLIAHPERSPALMAGGLGVVRAELEAGSVLLLNATSLLGRHGKDAQELALSLATSSLAAAVASDAHRPTRGPVLGRALAALLEGGVEAAAAHDMVDTAPRALLEGGLAARRLPVAG